MLEEIAKYVKAVESGYGHLKNMNTKKSFEEYLREYVEAGLIGQQEVHCAIIKGNQNRAQKKKNLLFFAKEGFFSSDYAIGLTIIQELKGLVSNGYVSQERADPVIIKGLKRRRR